MQRGARTGSNPVEPTRAPKYQKSKFDGWTEELAQTLISRANGPFRTYLIVAFGTGLERADLLTLCPEDLQQGQLGWGLDKKRGKTQQWVTQNPMLPEVWPTLERSTARFRCQDNEPILRNAKGQPWTADAIKSQWSRLKDRLSPEELEALGNKTLKGARTGFSERIKRAGWSKERQAMAMGHANYSMTAHYSRDVGQFAMLEPTAL